VHASHRPDRAGHPLDGIEPARGRGARDPREGAGPHLPIEANLVPLRREEQAQGAAVPRHAGVANSLHREAAPRGATAGGAPRAGRRQDAASGSATRIREERPSPIGVPRLGVLDP